VYCQSISQLEAVYGRAESEAIMSNYSAGQVFFPPRDLSTAQYLSRLFSEELEPMASSSGSESVATHGHTRTGSSSNWSVSTRYRRALTEAQALAMSQGSVAVFAAGRRAILVDSRTMLVRRLAQLPPPPEPEDVPEVLAPPRASITEVPRLPAPAPGRAVTPPSRQRKPATTTAPATTEVIW
jgi:hypothetical protein